MNRLSLIFPTLNEQDNIVPQIRAAIEGVPRLGEILVMDDSSTDATVSRVQGTFQEEIQKGFVRIFVRKENLGLAPALEEGVSLCRFPMVGWMDCDLSMPASLLSVMLEQLDTGVDVCLGSRFLKGGSQKSLLHTRKDSRVEILLSNLANQILRWAFRLPVTDFTSGFIVVRRELFQGVRWRGRHGEYFFDLLCQWQKRGAKLVEVPYSCGTRVAGQSKTFGSFSAGVRNSFRYGLAFFRILFSRIWCAP